MNWIDNLRIGIAEGTASKTEILEWVDDGERQLMRALNAMEALVEANAALREQVCELKASHRVARPPMEISNAPKASLSSYETTSPLGPKK